MINLENEFVASCKIWLLTIIITLINMYDKY